MNDSNRSESRHPARRMVISRVMHEFKKRDGSFEPLLLVLFFYFDINHPIKNNFESAILILSVYTPLTRSIFTMRFKGGSQLTGFWRKVALNVQYHRSGAGAAGVWKIQSSFHRIERTLFSFSSFNSIRVRAFCSYCLVTPWITRDLSILIVNEPSSYSPSTFPLPRAFLF